MSTPFDLWPLSWFNLAPGQLTQPINPGWSFGNVQVNYAGNADIEKEVVSKVASYGKQLGILTEVVLALAGNKAAKPDEPLARLRKIEADVKKIKDEHKGDLADAARDAMTSLAKENPTEARRIAADFAKASAAKST